MEEGRKFQNRKVYDQTAKVMAGKFNAIGARIHDIETIFSQVPAPDPHIVEIGCGNGRDGKEFAARTKNYIGIDNSTGMIEVARAYAPEAHFEVADMDTYNFPADMDAVVSFASLVHSDKAQVTSVLERVHAGLTPGGIFFISTKKGLYDEKGTEKTDEFGTRTYFLYTPRQIRELAGDKYETVSLVEQSLGGQDWFDIIFRRH